MGLHGCDASRDVADVILTGDSFDSIVSAIEEGTAFYFTFSWKFRFLNTYYFHFDRTNVS